jgi:hypothetical protein
MTAHAVLDPLNTHADGCSAKHIRPPHETNLLGVSCRFQAYESLHGNNYINQTSVPLPSCNSPPSRAHNSCYQPTRATCVARRPLQIGRYSAPCLDRVYCASSPRSPAWCHTNIPAFLRTPYSVSYQCACLACLCFCLGNFEARLSCVVKITLPISILKLSFFEIVSRPLLRSQHQFLSSEAAEQTHISYENLVFWASYPDRVCAAGLRIAPMMCPPITLLSLPRCDLG